MNLLNWNNEKMINKAKAKRNLTQNEKLERLAIELNSILGLDNQIGLNDMKDIFMKIRK